MKIMIELDERDQNLLYTLLSQTDPLAIKVRGEVLHQRELEKQRISSAKLARDTRIFVTEHAGAIKVLKQGEITPAIFDNPKSSRPTITQPPKKKKHTGSKLSKAKDKISKLTADEAEALIAKLMKIQESRSE